MVEEEGCALLEESPRVLNPHLEGWLIILYVRGCRCRSSLSWDTWACNAEPKNVFEGVSDLFFEKTQTSKMGKKSGGFIWEYRLVGKRRERLARRSCHHFSAPMREEDCDEASILKKGCNAS